MFGGRRRPVSKGSHETVETGCFYPILMQNEIRMGAHVQATSLFGHAEWCIHLRGCGCELQ